LYYGPVVGWYFAFLVHLIGWLIIPTVIGLAFGISFVVLNDYQSKFIPLYAVVMAIWSAIFLESWKRREQELSFSWDMHHFRQGEQ
jgi:hypothetical protein